ncbi:MAG: nucleotidyl transferase AbiEii/AbiGii toxin family protein [Candidatus Fermentibacteria bacterium]|nr:nucleotidyl transferase AbiEii/AbiGii toxin family protein [Candidatus Fermentibacteria bacterium]
MLQYRSIYPKTLELLKELMLQTCSQDFFLVGETALALQIGHRISIDIDMFTLCEFSSSKILSELEKYFAVVNAAAGKNSLSFDGAIQGGNNEIIKVDLIRYSYPLINPVQTVDNIRLLSVEDIIPMKLSAVAGRGSKKDFYDIFYLLDVYGLEQMISLFETKFPQTSKFHIVKSLAFFDDAESEPDPLTIENTDWTVIKERITAEVNVFASKQG